MKFAIVSNYAKKKNLSSNVLTLSHFDPSYKVYLQYKSPISHPITRYIPFEVKLQFSKNNKIWLTFDFISKNHKEIYFCPFRFASQKSLGIIVFVELGVYRYSEIQNLLFSNLKNNTNGFPPILNPLISLCDFYDNFFALCAFIELFVRSF